MTTKDNHFSFLVRINLSTSGAIVGLNFFRNKIVVILPDICGTGTKSRKRKNN